MRRKTPQAISADLILVSAVIPPRPLALLVLASVLASLAPTAASTWYGPGTAEPDTHYDAAHGSMFDAADTAESGQRVYFNAFQALPQTSLNPNLAATGSRVLPAPAAHHRAILGIWKDCNRDNYIGLAESAVQDYRSELLVDSTICPRTTYAGLPVHNDGEWVSELLTIGMVDPCEYPAQAWRAECRGITPFALNERVVYDNGTFVWGDVGAPGSIPPAECAILPLPRGSTTGTGALLGYADCQGDRGVARTVNRVDEDGSLGLRFDDEARPGESDSLLNAPFPVTPFGRPGQPGLLERDTEARTFTAWDCSDPKGGADVRDPTGRAPRSIVLVDPSGGRLTGPQFPQVILGVYFRDEDGDPSTAGTITVPLTDAEGSYAWAPAVRPGTGDPTASSAWASASAAADGPNGDCDPEKANAMDGAHPGARLESETAGAQAGRKDRTSFVFTFYDGHRGINPNLDPRTGPTTPSDGGLFYTDHDRGGDGPMWNATFQTDQDPQLVRRDTLGPTPAAYFTYYVRLSLELRSSGIEVPGSGTYVYGAQNCEGLWAGERNGWVCDPALWWRTPDGQDARPRYASGDLLGAVPGDAYTMRDVDCYDGTLAAAVPVKASLAQLSEEGPCGGA